jgi:hypothetical protein
VHFVRRFMSGLPVSCVQPELCTPLTTLLPTSLPAQHQKEWSMWRLVKTADLEGRDCRSIAGRLAIKRAASDQIDVHIQCSRPSSLLFISGHFRPGALRTCPSGMLVMKVKSFTYRCQCEASTVDRWAMSSSLRKRCDTNEA